MVNGFILSMHFEWLKAKLLIWIRLLDMQLEPRMCSRNE